MIMLSKEDVLKEVKKLQRYSAMCEDDGLMCIPLNKPLPDGRMVLLEDVIEVLSNRGG